MADAGIIKLLTSLADENRAMVVERNLVPIILALPEDNDLLPFHIPVIYNICLDYGKRGTSDTCMSSLEC